jgi:hypothetical protein
VITLKFRAVGTESPVLARAVYFRICSDATLRGPDNSVAAIYENRHWLVGQRRFRSFDCDGPVYLRTRTDEGSLVRTGPYSFLRESEGAFYAALDASLGIYVPGAEPDGSRVHWREIALLPAAS